MSLNKRNLSTVSRNGDARLRFGRRPRPDNHGYMFSKYEIVPQIINYKSLDGFSAILALNKLINTLHYVLLRKVELTQFDVKWAISRKRGYSENVRKYHTQDWVFLICSLYSVRSSSRAQFMMR